MRYETLQELAEEIPARYFILVYFAQRKEFYDTKKTTPRPVTLKELKQYFHAEHNLRMALSRMQDEKILIKVKMGAWIKNPAFSIKLPSTPEV